MSPLPSLDTLRCFVEAARLLNFRAAARAVFLTPAALGQRIQQLEGQVGGPLFHRTTRRVSLSETGLALLPHAQQALMAAEDCLRAARGETGPPPQEVVLGTRHELGISWIVPMLPVLRVRHPTLTFHLYFGSGGDLLLRVRGGEVQCAVGSMRVDDPKLDSVRLHREDYVFVLCSERREPRGQSGFFVLRCAMRQRHQRGIHAHRLQVPCKGGKEASRLPLGSLPVPPDARNVLRQHDVPQQHSKPLATVAALPACASQQLVVRLQKHGRSEAASRSSPLASLELVAAASSRVASPEPVSARAPSSAIVSCATWASAETTGVSVSVPASPDVGPRDPLGSPHPGITDPPTTNT